TDNVTYTGLTPDNHTVQLNSVPSNCSVSEANPQTVNVPAGGSATATFTITCPALPGSLTVSTSTTRSEQPRGGKETGDGWSSKSIGASDNVTYTGLTAANHTVQLNSVPSNCSVSEANPQTVNVPAGGSATASFTVTCQALPGSLTVSTSTTGSSQPSGYTVTVDGSQSRSIGANDNVTYTGLTAGNHAGQQNDVPANCSVSEANPQPVNVPAGGSTTASFTIACQALTGDLTVNTNTSGPNQPSSYTVSVSGGGSQPIDASGSVTFTGLTAGSH